jgi:hypothetical protein
MTDTDLLHDYANSRAVLIGTWDYKHLPSVDPAARNSLDRMEGLLTGPLCGWPKDRVALIRNRRNCGDLPHRLMRLYQGLTDVALFYFVGHGHIYDDELCLAMGDSPVKPEDAPLRLTVDLQFRHVRQALLACSARTKIVILDCCYAGVATTPGQTLSAAVDEIIGHTSGTGAFTIAACEPYHKAWFEPGKRGEPQTYFTKQFLDTVEAGLPGHGAGLPLGAVFTATADALASARRPQPTRSTRHDADRFIIARNTHPDAAPQRQAEPDGNGTSPTRSSAWTRRRRRRKYMTVGGVLATLAVLGGLAYALSAPGASHTPGTGTSSSTAGSSAAILGPGDGTLLPAAFTDTAGASFLQAYRASASCSQAMQTSANAVNARFRSDGCTAMTIGDYLEQSHTTGGSAYLMVSVEVISFPTASDADLAYGFLYATNGAYLTSLWCPPEGSGQIPCTEEGKINWKTEVPGTIRHFGDYLVLTIALRTDLSAETKVFNAAVYAAWASAYACGPSQDRGEPKATPSSTPSYLASWS